MLASVVGDGWPVREMSLDRFDIWFLYSVEPVVVVVAVAVAGLESTAGGVVVVFLLNVVLNVVLNVALNVVRQEVRDGSRLSVEGGSFRKGRRVGGSSMVGVVVLIDVLVVDLVLLLVMVVLVLYWFGFGR